MKKQKPLTIIPQSDVKDAADTLDQIDSLFSDLSVSIESDSSLELAHRRTLDRVHTGLEAIRVSLTDRAEVHDILEAGTIQRWLREPSPETLGPARDAYDRIVDHNGDDTLIAAMIGCELADLSALQ